MKCLIELLFTVAFLVLSSFADESSSTVRFSNKDQLSGVLSKLTTEQLTWDSPILEKPTSFFLKNVIDITLNPQLPDNRSTYEARVTMTNGDMIRGQLATVTDLSVELDTWFAGRMKLNRLMIANISIHEKPIAIYRGPTGINDWKQAGDIPAWTYHNLGFHSLGIGSIARNVSLPDECTISFDVAWRDSLMLSLFLFTDDVARERPLNGYELAFQHRSITLRNCKDQKFLGHTQNAVMLQENEKAHIEVRASLKSGKISVSVDNQVISIWTFPEVVPVGKMGQAIHFLTQNTSPINVSRIQVSEWNGETEIPLNTKGADERGIEIPRQLIDAQNEQSLLSGSQKKSRMELRNGDSIDGEVMSITDGVITAKTLFREIKLPVELLRSVALKDISPERSKREKRDVRGSLPDGSSFVFRLDQVSDDTMTGYSQNFGMAEFKISNFNLIEFNIYESNLEELRNRR